MVLTLTSSAAASNFSLSSSFQTLQLHPKLKPEQPRNLEAQHSQFYTTQKLLNIFEVEAVGLDFDASSQKALGLLG